MKATKVAMIGICLAYLYALIHGGYFNVKRIPVIYILGLLGAFAILVLGYQFIQVTGLLDRILYLYSLHGGIWGRYLVVALPSCKMPLIKWLSILIFLISFSVLV